VCADYAKKELHIKQLGVHPSRVATKVLQRGETYTLGPMGWLELLEGHYKYHVHFGADTVKSATVAAQEDQREAVGTSDIEDDPPRKKLKLSPAVTDNVQTTFSGPSSSALSLTWSEIDTLLVFQYGDPVNSSKIAAADVDNTIIETASGKKFAAGPTDWKLMSGVVGKLKSYTQRGYKLVLLSNQLGISKGKPTKEEFKQKVEAIALKLGVPLLLMAASAKDKFRKPCTGMWDHLLDAHNGNIKVDMASSFYVGDAAGREANWLPRKVSIAVFHPPPTHTHRGYSYPECCSLKGHTLFFSPSQSIIP
jgi:bifunctional polynucleotide phosphatase/kinase